MWAAQRAVVDEDEEDPVVTSMSSVRGALVMRACSAVGRGGVRWHRRSPRLPGRIPLGKSRSGHDAHVATAWQHPDPSLGTSSAHGRSRCSTPPLNVTASGSYRDSNMHSFWCQSWVPRTNASTRFGIFRREPVPRRYNRCELSGRPNRRAGTF